MHFHGPHCILLRSPPKPKPVSVSLCYLEAPLEPESVEDGPQKLRKMWGPVYWAEVQKPAPYSTGKPSPPSLCLPPAILTRCNTFSSPKRTLCIFCSLSRTSYSSLFAWLTRILSLDTSLRCSTAPLLLLSPPSAPALRPERSAAVSGRQAGAST